MKGNRGIRNNKGITLIALVITIIVMLILAGVSLNATIGDNGIIKRAQSAKFKQAIAAYKEDVDAYALGRNGSKELAGRLKSQKFRDINFGRLDSRKLEQINAIRATEGLEALTPDMKIPENVKISCCNPW